MSMFYTGVGSRTIPKDIKEFITEIATKLEELGWILRSGAADGADTAFENGVKNEKRKEIYIPWRGFNESTSKLYRSSIDEKAEEIAAENHPGWDYLKPAVRKLMSRNVYQVMGNKLNDNSRFLICYTEDGCESHKTRKPKTGGTGLAISVADKLGIPIFNLKNKESRERLEKFINKEK